MGAFFALAFFLMASGCAFAQSSENAKAIGAANVGVARLYHEGKYADALTLALQTVERAEKDLGEEHPQTLAVVNNLALVYCAQGRYSEAEPLFKRALEARERTLGKEHPDTLLSVNNLAFLYQTQGRYSDAEPLYKHALEASERLLGKEHPQTIGSANNLAFLYRAQGRYGEAELLSKRPPEPDGACSVRSIPIRLQSSAILPAC